MRHRVLALLMAAALPAALSEAQKLPSAITGLRPEAQAVPAQRAQLDALKSQRGVGGINIAKVSAQVIRSARLGQSLELNVAPGTSVVARAVAVETDGPRLLWRGEVASPAANLPPGMATLVVSGDGVTGSIRTSDGKLYRLRPLGGSETAIVLLDYATMPADHPPDTPGAEPHAARQVAPTTGKPVAVRGVQQAAKLDTATVATRLTKKPELLQAATQVRTVSLAERYRLRGDFWRYLVPPTIDVLVAYTPSAQTAAGDVPSLAALAVTETNDSFTNSNVWARLRLVGTMPVTYSESGRSFLQMVNHLEGTSDGFMDNVHAQRDALKADVVVLIINDGAYCGRAYDIHVAADGAFAVVYWDCATGYYSFGHEIAHLVGCRHDRANDSTATPFAWGHGFRHPVTSGGWRTVMGYRCSDGSCEPRLQYWSSPLSTWGGAAMGTADLEDNVRVWNERAATVAAFR
jgi:peptidyl-Asp metalloendopeptidase